MRDFLVDEIQMRNAIAAQHKLTATSASKTPLGPEKVKQWIHLVHMIRTQHKLACEIQAPHQILSIGLNIIFMANNLFLAVHSGVGYANNKRSMSYLPLAVVAITFGRLFFKCFMAEKMAEEVRLSWSIFMIVTEHSENFDDKIAGTKNS